MKPSTIDIVIPCYNEAQTAHRLFEELSGVISSIHEYDFRLILINDGSRDNTIDVLPQAKDYFHRVLILDLARNFGKEAAIKSGLAHANADAVIIMDADLQHPPSLIPEFIEQWQKGFDVVVAKRTDRNADGFLRRVGSNLFYWAINKMSEHRVENGEGDFRLITRPVVKALDDLREVNLFMKGLYGFVGFRKTTVDFVVPENDDRGSTFSGFGLIKLALTGLVAGSIVPLRFSLYTGLIIVFLSLLYFGFVVVQYLLGISSVAGYPTLVALVTLIGGANLIFVGVVGEYVGRIFMETKQRPQFIIAREIELEREDAKLD